MTKCFADVHNRCVALNAKACNGCKFFATKDQADKARIKSYVRRVSLGGPFSSWDDEYR